RAGTSGHIRYRRHRPCTWARRTALAGCCPRGETARSIRRQPAGSAREGADGAPIPLSRFRRDGDSWPQTRGRATRPIEALGARCVDALERRAHLFFDRLPESIGRGYELGVELCHLPTRHAPHHRHFRITNRRCTARGRNCRRGLGIQGGANIAGFLNPRPETQRWVWAVHGVSPPPSAPPELAPVSPWRGTASSSTSAAPAAKSAYDTIRSVRPTASSNTVCAVNLEC